MPFNRTSSRLALGFLVLLLAAPSYGQGPQGMQIFAPADLSTMGGDIEPNEGYFFQFDGLYWAVLPPKTTPVGFPGLTRNVFIGPGQDKTQSNTLDTSIIGTDKVFTPGDRFEFGRIEDRNGWFVSIFQLRDMEQDFVVPAADVVFQDFPTGSQGIQWLQGPVVTGGPNVNLPVTFFSVSMNHSTSTWGVELMYLHRCLTCHEGSTFEMFLGARYLYFGDDFAIVTGTGTAGLGGSSWTNSAENNVVGPQIGARWFKKRGRWMLSTEGRFLAGLNQQNIHQRVDFAPNVISGAVGQPALLGPMFATYDASPREWAPLVELRLEARYQITRAVSFHAGWTGLWMDGLARGDSTIDYSIRGTPPAPVLGIDLTRNRDNLFMNGLTLGFDVNR